MKSHILKSRAWEMFRQLNFFSVRSHLWSSLKNSPWGTCLQSRSWQWGRKWQIPWTPCSIRGSGSKHKTEKDSGRHLKLTSSIHSYRHKWESFLHLHPPSPLSSLQSFRSPFSLLLPSSPTHTPTPMLPAFAWQIFILLP